MAFGLVVFLIPVSLAGGILFLSAGVKTQKKRFTIMGIISLAFLVACLLYLGAVLLLLGGIDN